VFTSRDGVPKVLNGSMVMLKGVRHNNLYYFKGNIVKGQLVTLVGINDESTKLWRMRLGHTCEKYL